jgi:hypothetical protein
MPAIIPKLGAILLAATCVSAWDIPSSAEPSTEPSLAETLAWVDGTYNNHMNEGGAIGHGDLEIYSDPRSLKMTKRLITKFTYQNCDDGDGSTSRRPALRLAPT